MEGWNKVWKVPSNPNHSVVLQALSLRATGELAVLPHRITHISLSGSPTLCYDIKPSHLIPLNTFTQPRDGIRRR